MQWCSARGRYRQNDALYEASEACHSTSVALPKRGCRRCILDSKIGSCSWLAEAAAEMVLLHAELVFCSQASLFRARSNTARAPRGGMLRHKSTALHLWLLQVLACSHAFPKLGSRTFLRFVRCCWTGQEKPQTIGGQADWRACTFSSRFIPPVVPG